MGFFSQISFAQGTLVPACNLIGPLEACAVADPNDTSGDIIINVEVARSGAPNLLNATTNLNFTYSFPSNSSGAFIRTFGNVVYNAGLNKTTQTLVVFPGSSTPEFNLQLDVVNISSSPNTICECSKSVSISKVAATASHTPITCAGGTSTLTVVGQFSDIGNYSYTLLPSGPTNFDGIFPGLPGSEAGITYTVSVMSAEECVTNISETITTPPANPILLNCPPQTTTNPCLTQDQINTAFNAWLASFSFSGGTNSVSTRSPLNPAPPARCGGSTDVTWTVTDDCGQSQSCTRTFTVPAPPAVVLTCPVNTTTGSCQTQAAVNAAFTAWLATASGNGGCNGNLSNNNTGAPPACGGSTTVTFTYTSSCAPLSTTCQATFTVSAAPSVSLTCPGNLTTSACQTQAAVNAAFTAWLATASGNGGCGGNLSNNNTGAPPACGGSRTVTFTYTSSCVPLTSTCQATFTVPSSPAVTLTCPTNQSIPGGQTQASVDAAYAAWLATASGSGGCGGALTNNSTGAPPACGGSKTVTFSYSNSCGQPTTCQATFSTGTCIVSHIFPTQTTCCNYVTGTATGLYNVCTKLSGRTVNNAIPGVFFYYASVVAPSSSFTINVKQTNDGDLNKLFTIQNAQQIRLTNASCGNVSFAGSMLNGGTEAKYAVTGATAGATYIVSLKYDVKSIIGAVYTGADNKSTYTFGSYVNNVLYAPSAGTIDALGGCEDNTPAPGNCSLPSGKQISSVDMAIYPNPFTSNFKLDVKSASEEDIQIRVYDMLGKTIDTSTLRMSDIDSFELGNNYPAGIYNVIITQGTEVRTQRVIKR
ncbi:T9SS type A sorting domain-containing protein [Flavobacterium wongokense]|uniref:T9SS type A sorting domain-containing protein n=1 Tax=Flavobacterium wongokense TaxID=2910674 RepID=UPI001F236095|nr:T9SS type A sorting domain-containing protein [Flavobacterium sp. WG47]MCF6130752.1 T9SS type A sorting domain-containing protein [Flavobacterium sp. WG47]